MEKKHRIQFTIDIEMWERLQKISEMQGRIPGNLVKHLLLTYLKQGCNMPKKRKKPYINKEIDNYEKRVTGMLLATKEFKKDKGYIYFLKMDINNKKYCKIGKTKNLKRRLDRIDETIMPVEKKLFIAFEVNHISKIEGLFHKYFTSRRKEGEWFELLTSDYNDIKREGLGLIKKEAYLINTIEGTNDGP